MTSTQRNFMLFVIRVLRFVVGLFLTLATLAFLAIFGLQYFHDSKILEAPLILRLDRLIDPTLRLFARWSGQRWPISEGVSFLPLAASIAALILKSVLDWPLAKLEQFVRTAFRPRRFEQHQSRGGSASSSAASLELSAESERSREELIKRYRQIEQALKSTKQKRCTLLSIDVVGSTQMKIGERPTAIAATFQAYEEMVREMFDAYGVWKQTWTPDGVMACFLDRDLAVSAAKQCLIFLKKFNAHDNHLRTPFQVRAGLNEGDLAIFEDSSLEKVADRVIDVAGHMQKHANVDALWLSAEVHEALADRSGFKPIDAEVDGYRVYEWRPENLDAPEAER